MKTRLKFQIFSKVILKSETKAISCESARTKQVIKLLLYILMRKERDISHQELIEAMWGETHTSNPTGALKNLIYRLRTTLQELGDNEYILSRRGFYRWNEEIVVESDYEEFEQFCTSAQSISENEGKQYLYRSAMKIYTGNVDEDFASESWMIPAATWYQSMYLGAARELIQIYSEESDFVSLQKVCVEALKVDELDENLHYWLMRSLMKQYKVDLALKHYNETTRLFQKHLGIKTSELLSDVYKELISMKAVNDSLDGSNILQELIESETEDGVYFCKFAIFREIFRVESRRAQRSKDRRIEFVLLFTMSDRGYYNETEEGRLYNIRIGMERLENVLRVNLRAGDVVCRYSDNQFVVLLSTCKQENAMSVARRLTEALFKQYSSKKVSLRCEMLVEGNNVITITE